MASWTRKILRGSAGAGTFYGGVFLPAEKHRTADRPIEPIPLPTRLFVPLGDHRDRIATPCVQPGRAVGCGEPIAHGDGLMCPSVHAPADGVVRSPAVCDTPDMPELPCVEIDVRLCADAVSAVSGTKPTAIAIRTPADHGAVARGPSAGTGSPVMAEASISTIDDLVAHVSAMGIVGQGGPGTEGRTTAQRLRDAADRGCEHVVINAMESDPCVTADWRVLVEQTEDVLAGAQRIARLLRVRDVRLAVDAALRQAISHIVAAARGTPVRVVPLVNKYPQGHMALLVQALLGREIPYGGADLDLGVLTIGVGTIAAIETSLRTGQPLTRRVVTVSGDAAQRPGNYSVAIGTPIRHVIEFVGLRAPATRIIAGSPMTGIAIDRLDTVITRTTTAILLAGREFAPRRNAASPEACTRCGWCLDDCPVGLDPAALLNAAERRRLDQAEALRVHACIGCGLCSYGCPAGLPIAESIRSVRMTLEDTHREPLADRTTGNGARVGGGGST